MEPLRILVYDRLDNYLCDVDPTQLLGATSVEEINGEHSITITTTQTLAKTNRLLVQDGRGYWHEYVITGIEESHISATGVAKEYYAIWSLQYDLATTYVNDQYGAGIVPGHASIPVSVSVALSCALEGTKRWTVGTTSVTTMASASFYRRSGWEAMKTVIERWGGELEASITVGLNGVTARRLNLLEHVGSSEVSRRFDYGADLKDIRRTVSDDVWPCRIIPLGKSQETDSGGYSRRPDISSVNGGVPWLEDSEVVPYVRVHGPNGWEYPTAIIENNTYEAPADLKVWAQEHITDYTRPKVSYSASVVQFVKAGLNPHGVSLGDVVYVVDRDFGGEALRLAARVVKIEEDLLDSSRTNLTIGNVIPTLAGQFSDLYSDIFSLSSMVADGYEYQEGTSYLSRLLQRINEETNASGGYTYITEGQGLRTYDVAVSDPLVGAEASRVVEIKGGTIRIANSRTSGGDWEWKTVFQSGFISANLIMGGTLMLGGANNVNGRMIVYNANGVEVSRFDNNGAVIRGSVILGGVNNVNGTLVVYDANGTVVTRLDNNGAYIQGDVEMYRQTQFLPPLSTIRRGRILAGELSITNSDLFTMLTGGSAGGSLFNIPGLQVKGSDASTEFGNIWIIPPMYTRSSYNDAPASIYCEGKFQLLSGPASAASSSSLSLGSVTIDEAYAGIRGQNSYAYAGNGNVRIFAATVTITAGSPSSGIVNVEPPAKFTRAVTMSSSLTVSGTKNRAVETEHYDTRLQYAYETAAPYFGDIGSSAIGEDGLAFVALDDIFAETARTDMAYQVFLQKCGQGDLWVSEKHAGWFVVEGTPNLPFDWEVKCQQSGYETTRLEDASTRDDYESAGDEDLSVETLYPNYESDRYEPESPEYLYQDEYAYIHEIEALYGGAA